MIEDELRKACHAAWRNGPIPLGNSLYFQEASGLKRRLIRKNSDEAALSNSSHPGIFFVRIVTSRISQIHQISIDVVIVFFLEPPAWGKNESVRSKTRVRASLAALFSLQMISSLFEKAKDTGALSSIPAEAASISSASILLRSATQITTLTVSNSMATSTNKDRFFR